MAMRLTKNVPYKLILIQALHLSGMRLSKREIFSVYNQDLKDYIYNSIAAKSNLIIGIRNVSEP